MPQLTVCVWRLSLQCNVAEVSCCRGFQRCTAFPSLSAIPPRGHTALGSACTPLVSEHLNCLYCFYILNSAAMSIYITLSLSVAVTFILRDSSRYFGVNLLGCLVNVCLTWGKYNLLCKVKNHISREVSFFLFFLGWSLLLKLFCPGGCGSVDWALACEPKGRWFDSQSGHMPGLWVRSPVGGAQEATTHWCFSSSFFPPFSSL